MWHVAKGKGTEFNNGVREFINSALTCEYKKTLFYDKDGELIKEKLTWSDKPRLEKVFGYGNLIQLLAMMSLCKHHMRQSLNGALDYRRGWGHCCFFES